MRFYFHLHNDHEAVDEDGVEMPGAASALQKAQGYAREMAAENVKEGRLNLSHFIEVTNEAGTSLFTVTFGEAVEIIE